MILEYGNIPYIDVSHTQYFGTSGWKESKSKTPYGSLPILDVDGQPLAQTAAIVKYCCHLVPELCPVDPLQAAKAESIYQAAEELSRVNPLVNVYRGDQYAQLKSEYFTSLFPSKAAKLSGLITAAGGPYTLGADPHYGDFYVYHVVSNSLIVDPTCLGSEVPEVWSCFMSAVESLKGVKEYLAGRPRAVSVGTRPMLDPNIVGSRVQSS